MIFEWDYEKDLANQEKHGISFTEAISIFDDPNAMSLFDEEHSQQEERWIELGRISSGLVCVVIHTFRDVNGDEHIRIISAREATKKEESQYYKGD